MFLYLIEVYSTSINARIGYDQTAQFYSEQRSVSSCMVSQRNFEFKFIDIVSLTHCGRTSSHTLFVLQVYAYSTAVNIIESIYSESADSDAIAENLATAYEHLRTLTELETKLFYAEGAGFASEIANGDAQRQLALTNGCYRSSNPAECLSLENGLFGKGLHAALSYYNGALHDILNTLQTQTFASSTERVRCVVHSFLACAW